MVRRADWTSRRDECVSGRDVRVVTSAGVRQRRLGYVQRVQARQPGIAGWVVDAMTHVPRHAFLDRLYTSGDAGWAEVVSGDPGHLDLCYTVQSWPIQLNPDCGDDGDTGTRRDTAVPGAWCPDPATLAAMLTALDVEDGMTVVTLPTGSAYATGLLSRRLGPGLVTSVDVDSAVVAQAQAALAGCGLAAAVEVGTLTGPRRRGHRFDRLLAIGGVPYIPPTWLDMVRPGGQIVTGVGRLVWRNRPTPLAALTVYRDGSALGRLIRHPSTLPPLDAPDPPHRILSSVVDSPDTTTPVGETPTDLDASVLADPDFAAWATLHLPELTAAMPDRRRGGYWFGHRDGSLSMVDPATRRVIEYGPTIIGHRLQAAHDAWRNAGAPTIDHIKVALDPTSCRLRIAHSDELRLSTDAIPP
jgi:protein-L-isoaspartate O-methyltransferase